MLDFMGMMENMKDNETHAIFELSLMYGLDLNTFGVPYSILYAEFSKLVQKMKNLGNFHLNLIENQFTIQSRKQKSLSVWKVWKFSDENCKNWLILMITAHCYI